MPSALRLFFQVTLALTLLLPIARRASAQAQDTLGMRHMFMYTPNLSANAGADNLLSLYYGVTDIEDDWLPHRHWQEARFWGKTGGIFYRLGKLAFIDDPSAIGLSVTQHEVFGHGFRARELGFTQVKYEVDLPPPYGNGGGQTSYQGNPKYFSWDADLAVVQAGVEADGVLGAKLRGYWMQAGAVDYHGAVLYMRAMNDLKNYLSVSNEEDLDSANFDGGNDMLSYISLLNGKEGYATRQEFHLHLHRIQNQTAIMYCDPFLWYSIWAVLKSYLWSGQGRFAYPSIPIGPIRYLPSCSYGLTPWGPEYFFDNMLAVGPRVFTLGYRSGVATFRHFWGLGINALQFADWNGILFDGSWQIWRQPRLRLEADDTTPADRRLGMGETLTAIFPPMPLPFPLRIAMGIDYKDAGFLPGENLQQGFTWRAGLSLSP